MEINKDTFRKLMLLITFAIVLGASIQHLDLVSQAVLWGLGMLAPFLFGLAGAFVLNLPMRALEAHVFKPRPKLGAWYEKLRRPLSLTLSVVCVLGLLSVVVGMIWPQLRSTVSMLIERTPDYIAFVRQRISTLEDDFPSLVQWVDSLKIDWAKLQQSITEFLQKGLANAFFSVTNAATSVFNGVTGFVLGFIFAINALFQKERVLRQFERVLRAYVPHRADRIVYICTKANRSFASFISGQALEALILGVLCFLGMLAFRFPYASLISVLVGCSALIPIFGAFLSTFVGALLILTVSPAQAFWFVVFFIVLQQLEGNLIYPRVVGTSVGLPAMWVLVAITIGGGLMGIWGMLIGTPIASVLYSLLRENTTRRLKRADRPQSAKKP